VTLSLSSSKHANNRDTIVICNARHDVIIFIAGAERCQISGVDTDTAD